MGIGTDQAYALLRTLPVRPAARPIIVAVIDADLAERYYGNPDVEADPRDHGTEHSTHCAGIITADRTNGLGVRGVAYRVRVLSVRCAPAGDERDKDVANVIRYAVDNGAEIINMSFGKYFSPEKAAVAESMRYANTKDVLLVPAVGNDHLNIDTTA